MSGIKLVFSGDETSGGCGDPVHKSLRSGTPGKTGKAQRPTKISIQTLPGIHRRKEGVLPNLAEAYFEVVK